MKVIDISGKIQNGMWNYPAPFPKFDLKPLEKVPWVDGEVYCEIFEGLHSQTGTYLETPAHFFGNDSSYLISDIPVEKLINIPCVVFGIDGMNNPVEATPITKEMLISSSKNIDISKGCALLISTGWGKHWMEKCFLQQSPYFTYEAMLWLISKKPFLLGTDFPRWENIKKSEGFFEAFYRADILMLAPCINLEKVEKSNVKLTVLPLNITGTSCVPCRAVLIEDGECCDK